MPEPRPVSEEQKPKSSAEIAYGEAEGETLRPQHDALLSLLGTQETAGRAGRLLGTGSGLDRYEVREEIGRGGMAVVYRAVQKDLGREVALKKVTYAHRAVREKFVAECRVSGLLEHPAIIPVYDLLESEDALVLVMKLVRGQSWRDLLRAKDERAPRDLDHHLEILLQVANAVAFAHSKGLLHDDLKPANVLVGEFGEVLVGDWGLAVDYRDAPEGGSVAPPRTSVQSPSGTPGYWAPELAEGRGADLGPWTDVYLLGSILYELVNGHPPHQAEGFLGSIHSATRDAPPPFHAPAPPSLVEICQRAMAPASAARYPSVAAFQEALRTFLKTRESMRITQKARETLEGSLGSSALLMEPSASSTRRAGVYANFIEAAAAFRQALLLWPDNRDAAEGERRARLSLASLALESGDLSLAEVELSRLPTADPEAAELSQRIRAAQENRKREARAASRLRRGLLAAVVIIVGGLAAGLFVIRSEQRRSEAQLAGIRRLADVKLLSELSAEAEGLWPALPERAAAMAAWLEKAKMLSARLATHRAYLGDLRKNAVESSPAPRFATPEEQWEHDTLAALVADLERFERSTVAGVEGRLAFARTVRKASLEERAEIWARAVASIADPSECPAYKGLRIAPQLGLVPLGTDPRSGLWEFAHLASGEVPERNPEGELLLKESTGVVLVLLPGGTFSMGTRAPDGGHRPGTPNVDPAARPSEGPVHEVELTPFFLAKHEVTQGQWQRATGSNPSAYPAGAEIGGRTHTLLHPVEQIKWGDAKRVLGRLGLALPTEAQWEYGARGGTTTVYWTGDAKESIAGAVNIADRYCKEHGGPGSWGFELWIDDGYVVHAPVGTYQKNPFGLHEVTGNVWEWAEDHYGGYDLPVRPGTGERLVPKDTPRVFRGGGFRSNAVHVRSGDRYTLYASDFVGFDVGVRAARPLE